MPCIKMHAMHCMQDEAVQTLLFVHFDSDLRNVLTFQMFVADHQTSSYVIDTSPVFLSWIGTKAGSTDAAVSVLPAFPLSPIY